MQKDVIELIENVRTANNPSVKAAKLSFYLSDMLENKNLNVYEAYLLQWEVIAYRREGYMLPAWSGQVQISTCLEILNLRLLALAFDEKKGADQLYQWGLEALQLCAEKRKHYVMDRYIDFMSINDNHNVLLSELLNVRKNYGKLSDNKGPYHVEVFPFDYIEPERILLENRNIEKDKCISTEIEKILIDINI